MRRIDRVHLEHLRIMFVRQIRTFKSSLDFLFLLLIMERSSRSFAMRILFHDLAVYCLIFNIIVQDYFY